MPRAGANALNSAGAVVQQRRGSNGAAAVEGRERKERKGKALPFRVAASRWLLKWQKRL